MNAAVGDGVEARLSLQLKELVGAGPVFITHTAALRPSFMGSACASRGL